VPDIEHIAVTVYYHKQYQSELPVLAIGTASSSFSLIVQKLLDMLNVLWFEGLCIPAD
jgi:hypothetical protein